MRARRTAASLVTLSLTLQGCTTYVGQKLPDDGSQIKGDTGMPYNLTRHEFTLKVAADPTDDTKPVYTLQRTSVPDPKQRYSLRLAPGFLTDGTMTYNYGPAGNLGNAEASTSSQVVATIKAAGALITNVIGAKTALKDEATVWDRFMLVLGKNPAVKGCEGGLGIALVAYENDLSKVAAKKFPTPTEVVNPKDNEEREAAKKAKNVAKSQQAAWIADRFHYRTAAEKACLAGVKANIEADALTELEDTANQAVAQVTSDPDAAKELKRLIDNKKDPDIFSTKLSALDKKGSDLKPAYDKALAYLNSVQDNKLAAKIAQFYVDMPLDVWRARHLAYVETDLEKARLALQVLLASAPKKTEPKPVQTTYAEAVKKVQGEVKSLEDQRDQLVDAADLKRRIAAIDALLDSGKTGSGEGRARLSIDRDRLQGLWQQARADLLAKNQSFDLAPKPKPDKVKPKDAEAVALVTQEFIECVKDGKQSADAKLPPFVVVMRPVKSATPMQQAASDPERTLPRRPPVNCETLVKVAS